MPFGGCDFALSGPTTTSRPSLTLWAPKRSLIVSPHSLQTSNLAHRENAQEVSDVTEKSFYHRSLVYNSAKLDSRKRVDGTTIVSWTVAVLDWIGRILVLLEIGNLVRRLAPKFRYWWSSTLGLGATVFYLATWLRLPHAFRILRTRSGKRMLPFYPVAACSFFLWYCLFRITRWSMKSYLHPFGLRLLPWSLVAGGLAKTYWVGSNRSESRTPTRMFIAMAFMGITPRIFRFLGPPLISRSERSRFFSSLPEAEKLAYSQNFFKALS